MIPEKKRPDRWRARCGHPLNFGRIVYRHRNEIERDGGWLKETRHIAARSEKLAVH